MKKLLKISVLAFFFASSCFAENSTLLIPQSSLMDMQVQLGEEDEVKTMEQLIQTTSQQLEMQKKMRELMLLFQNQRDTFIKGNQTKSHTGQMVRTARQIYELISENHIEHLFAKDYLDELTFFSSIAGKKSVTRP